MSNETNDLSHLLKMAGISESSKIENEEQEVYTQAADYKPRMPNHKINNPRFADNSLEEDKGYFPAMSPRDIVDMYFDYAAISDHDEAVARVADELGLRGEDVAKLVQQHAAEFAESQEFSEDFDDYNQVDAREEPPVAKGFKDYLSDLGAEREIKHAEQKFSVRIEWLDASYNSQFTTSVVAAGTPKEAEQKAINDLRTKNGGKLNMIDAEVESAE